jgi:hypothetical protein
MSCAAVDRGPRRIDVRRGGVCTTTHRELFSGRATDPGSGPLIILFALRVLGATSRDRKRVPARGALGAVGCTAEGADPSPALTPAS